MADRTILLRDGSPVAVSTLVGEIKTYAGFELPVGWFWCDGTLQLVATYPDLFSKIGFVYGAGTTSLNRLSLTSGSSLITAASSAPSLGSWIGFAGAGDLAMTLPAGVSSNTQMPLYVLERPNSLQFRVSLGPSSPALVASATSGPWDRQDSFATPDLRGRVPFGRDNMSVDANRLTTVTNDGDILGVSFGEETHLLLSSESGLPSHSHNYGDKTRNIDTVNRASGGLGTAAAGQGATDTTRATDSNTAADAVSAHNNLPPGLVVNYIIRYQ